MTANVKQISVEMLDGNCISFLLPLCFSHIDEMAIIMRGGYTFKSEGVVCHYPPSSIVKITSQPAYCATVPPNLLPAPEELLPKGVAVEFIL